jgi:glyoxylase I family protein
MAHVAVRPSHAELTMPIEMRGICTLLQVFDMPASLRFYCDGLGFEVLQSSAPLPDAGWAWLRRGDAELMLNTAFESEHRPPAADAGRLAAHADTGLYIACPDVDGAYRQLLAEGIAVKPPKVAPYGMKQLYVSDPDGYLVCFQSGA